MDLVTLALAKKYTNEHGGVAYTNHAVLTNRDAENAHTIGSITGLQAALDTKADAEDVPTKTSDLQNDSGFLTEHQDISGKQDVIDSSHKLSVDLVSGYTTKTMVVEYDDDTPTETFQVMVKS